jgi:NADH:ubiquinone oxidoreductase subunit 2 (subunit N)
MFEALSTENIWIFGPIVSNDIYVDFSKLFVTILLLVIMNFFISYFLKNPQDRKVEHVLLLTLFLLFIFLFTAASNFIVAAVSLTGASLCVYPFFLLPKGMNPCLEAGMKYYLLSTVSTLFFIGGIIFLLFNYGVVDFSNIRLFSSSTNTKTTALAVMISFLLIGLGFKISAFPTHS